MLYMFQMMEKRFKLLYLMVFLYLFGRSLESTENCLHLSENGSCSCCKTGFTGPSCTDICDHCESRLLQNFECKKKCSDGYYGTKCEDECPENCSFEDGKTQCERKDGECNQGCKQGFHGNQCYERCGENCLNSECEKRGGKCFECKDKRTYGERCDVSCSNNCYNRTCETNGTCSEGCINGFYGAECSSSCGKGCKNKTCRSDNNNTYICTEECLDGYALPNCSLTCTEECWSCKCTENSCSCLKDGKTTLIVTVAVLIAVIMISAAVIIPLFIKIKRPCGSGTHDEEMVVHFRRLDQTDSDLWETNPLTYMAQECDVFIYAASGKNPLKALLLQAKDADADKKVVFLNKLDVSILSQYRGRDDILIFTTEEVQRKNTEDDDAEADKTYIFIVNPNRNLKPAVVEANASFSELDTKKITQRIMENDNVNLLMHFLIAYNNAKHELFVNIGDNCTDVLLYLLKEDIGNDIISNACKNRRIKILEKMNAYAGEIFKDMIKRSNADGQTPVMLAALSGSYECFERVYEPTVLYKVDGNGNTVFHLACLGGNLDIVKKVFSKMDLERPGQMSRTPIMLAAAGGHEEVFDFLQEKGAKMDSLDERCDTMLHLSCEGNNVSIVQKISRGRDVQGFKGRTPSMKAAYHGHYEVFKHLRDDQPDPIDADGNTFLHLACIGGNVKILEEIWSPGTEPNARGADNMTPIMVAAFNGKEDIFDFFKTRDADLSLTDSEQRSLLQLAILGGNFDIVKKMECTITTMKDEKKVNDIYTVWKCAKKVGNKDISNYLYKHFQEVMEEFVG